MELTWIYILIGSSFDLSLYVFLSFSHISLSRRVSISRLYTHYFLCEVSRSITLNPFLWSLAFQNLWTPACMFFGSDYLCYNNAAILRSIYFFPTILIRNFESRLFFTSISYPRNPNPMQILVFPAKSN